MLFHFTITLLGLLSLTSALPLNINLGAYSPALVVGDGEISFGGKESVTNLMNALEGAAVNAAGANGAPAAAPAAPATTAKAAAIVQPTLAVEGAAVSTNPTVIATATPQGLGNPIEPRPRSVPVEARSVDTDASLKEVRELVARDLAGFDRALNYATAALKTSPAVELGTGEKGSGVGIKQGAGVDNGGPRAAPAAAAPAAAAPAAPAAPAAAPAAPAGERRDTVTIITRGDGSAAVEKRDVLNLKEKTAAIDEVNLNVSDPAGLTLTFVEKN